MGSTGATRSYLNFHHTLCAQTRPLKIQTDFRHSEENNYNKTVFKYSAEKTISITYQITIKEKLYLSKNKKPRITARLVTFQKFYFPSKTFNNCVRCAAVKFGAERA